MTGRSNSRAIRSSRSRSPLTPQVANRIRISSATSDSEKSNGAERGNSREAGVPRFKYRSLDDLIEEMENDPAVNTEIEEGDDEDEEDMSELLLLPMYTEEREEGEVEMEGEMENDNDPDDRYQGCLPIGESREVETRISEVHEPEPFYHDNFLSSDNFQKSSETVMKSLERSRSTLGVTVPTPDNKIILASASAPVLERYAGGGIKTRSVKDMNIVQGNATTAARSLRDMEILDPRTQKQQSIEYLSK